MSRGPFQSKCGTKHTPKAHTLNAKSVSDAATEALRRRGQLIPRNNTRLLAQRKRLPPIVGEEQRIPREEVVTEFSNGWTSADFSEVQP